MSSVAPPASSSSLSPPHIVPARFRRKSSSGAVNKPLDEFAYSPTRRRTSSLLPTGTSIPLMVPFNQHTRLPGKEAYNHSTSDRGAHLARHAYIADVHAFWPRHVQRNTLTDSITCHPSPSLMVHFSSLLPRNKDPFVNSLSDDIPSMSSDSIDGDGSTVDDECDLESMDIRLRESYFEVSAERGRWKSSPAIPLTHTQIRAPSPAHVCSVPGFENDAIELPARTRRQSTASIACTDDSTSSLFDMNDEERDESRFSSPLPSSSPPTSPMSFAASLPEDYPLAYDCMTMDDQMALPLSDDDQLLSSDSDHTADKAHRDVSRDLPKSMRLSKLELSVPDPNRTHHPCTNSPSYQNDDNQRLLACVCQSSAENIRASREQNHSCSPGQNASGPDIGSCSEEAQPSVFFVELPHVQAATSSLGTGIPPKTSTSTEAAETVKVSSKKSRSSGVVPKDLSKESGTSIPRKSSVAKIARAPSERNKVPTSGAKRGESSPNTRLERPKKKCKLSDNGQGSWETQGRSRSRKHQGKTRTDGKSPRLKSCHRAEESTEERSPCQTRAEPQAVSSSSSSPSPSHPHPQSPLNASEPHSAHELQTEAGLTGMLVEALATSRATSMDIAALHLVLIRAHPDLAAERPKKVLLKLIGTTLEAGRTRCGMFEKVRSSGEGACVEGEDELNAQGRWFYVPEKDEDKERAGLISALMPRQRRSETMKYKRYYWKPLDRISRWDPEDAL